MKKSTMQKRIVDFSLLIEFLHHVSAQNDTVMYVVIEVVIITVFFVGFVGEVNHVSTAENMFQDIHIVMIDGSFVQSWTDRNFHIRAMSLA
jgi:hypothetical protein